MDVRARSVGPARPALHPLPALGVPVVRNVHDEVFADGLGDGLFDFLAGGMVGEGVLGRRDAPIGDEAAFVGDGFEGVRPAGDRDFEVGAASVPAEFLDEQRAKVEVFQTADDFISVGGRRHREPA